MKYPYTGFYYPPTLSAGTDICKPYEMVVSGQCDAEPATVWSIGIMAYRTIAKKCPFRGDSDIEEGKLEFSKRFSPCKKSVHHYFYQC